MAAESREKYNSYLFASGDTSHEQRAQGTLSYSDRNKGKDCLEEISSRLFFQSGEFFPR